MSRELGSAEERVDVLRAIARDEDVRRHALAAVDEATRAMRSASRARRRSGRMTMVLLAILLTGGTAAALYLLMRRRPEQSAVVESWPSPAVTDEPVRAERPAPVSPVDVEPTDVPTVVQARPVEMAGTAPIEPDPEEVAADLAATREELVQEWIARRGKDVVDIGGEKVGTLQEVYVDSVTGAPEWMLVSSGTIRLKLHMVPLRGTLAVDAGLQVPFTRDLVHDAPQVEDTGELSDEEEDRLYLHYGLERPVMQKLSLAG